MKEILDLNNLFVASVGIVMTSKVNLKQLKQKDVRTLKTALLCKTTNSIGMERYYDVETGVWISSSLNGLCKGEYFIDTSKYFIEYSKFLQTFGITFDDNKIEKTEALHLFRDKIQMIYRNIELSKMERTLTIIKPDAMDKIDKIIEMFYQNGLKITDYKIKKLDEDLVKDHYFHLLDKPFFPKLRDFMMSSEVAIMILEGENAVEKLRKLMGPTDSTKADADTIRGKFGTDVTYNAIHGSDSVENAEIEIKRFFRQKQKRI